MKTKQLGCPSCADSAEHEWAVISPEGKIFYGETLIKAVLKARGKSESEFLKQMTKDIYIPAASDGNGE